MTDTTTHPFTKAGMGEAPFRMTVEDAAHRRSRLMGAFGVCDYCGTIITRPYFVKSACGKVSMVGCNCVAKIAGDDPALAREVDDARREADRRNAAAKKKAAKARDTARVDAAFARLAEPGVREKLAAMPHPKFSDATMLDYVEWMGRNAGTAGKLKAAAIIEGVDGA